nr:unnamed protein product [Spirometra erinaceieuropaei]
MYAYAASAMDCNPFSSMSAEQGFKRTDIGEGTGGGCICEDALSTLACSGLGITKAYLDLQSIGRPDAGGDCLLQSSTVTGVYSAVLCSATYITCKVCHLHALRCGSLTVVTDNVHSGLNLPHPLPPRSGVKMESRGPEAREEADAWRGE